MALKDIEIRNCYETGNNKNELLDSFYIPVLENSKCYFRIAGFFSSTSLSIAAKGIEGLIKNNGKMYLLISPELSNSDYETIKEHGFINENMDLFSQDDFSVVDENFNALAWLLDQGRLEIKIVVGNKTTNSLFHQKIGIFEDDNGDAISFSGSINETAQAWLNNIEEFKVFKSWNSEQNEYLSVDKNKFLDYWNDNRKDIANVFDIPTAVREKIIKKKPNDIWDLKIMQRYKREAFNGTKKENTISLFDHQKKAIEAWIENEYVLLMEMATGTGKTRTAIGCIAEELKGGYPVVVIVATPQGMLSRQWEEEINKLGVKFDRSIIVDGSNQKKWKELELLFLDISDGLIEKGIIYTTHKTSSSEKFISIVSNNKYATLILSIVDEVHAIASKKQRDALLEIYDHRIGLSATPNRMFDAEGTNLIKKYYYDHSYSFSIYDALHTINPMTSKPFLNNYYYFPIFVCLTEEEEKQYAKYSKAIMAMKATDDYDPEELERLYDKRADIGKNASNKICCFRNLLIQLEPNKIYDTIAFVSEKQIEKVFSIMTELEIKRAKVTEEESSSKIVSIDGKTERQKIIEQFKRRDLQVLVGMKCLDEGIDIPNARIALLMSNSTNPREYIQRIGRIVRQSEGKDISEIYDFIVTPQCGISDGSGILEKETRRAAQIAANALNFEEVTKVFFEKGVDINAY